MKTLNQKIVRILLNHCETLKHGERLIQVIPNGDIEEIANEIEQQVQNCLIADVVKSDCKTCGGKEFTREKDGSLTVCLDC